MLLEGKAQVADAMHSIVQMFVRGSLMVLSANARVVWRPGAESIADVQLVAACVMCRQVTLWLISQQRFECLLLFHRQALWHA
jgi:hypothetical protein